MLKLNEYAAVGECVYTETLPGGLRLIVIPRREYRSAHALLAIRCGGVDRRFRLDGEWLDVPAGCAHYLEHKLFELDGKDAMTEMALRGADANAFTDAGMTAFYFECTDGFPEHLRLLLSCALTPRFTEEGVQRERDIIREELLEAEDDPEERLYRNLVRSRFAVHPVREPEAGTVESIGRITAETLRRFHKAFYVPANMVLAVAGDLDPERVRALAAECFPAFGSPPPERDYGEAEDPFPLSVRTEEAMEVAAPLFLAGVKTEPGLWGLDGARFRLTAALAMDTLLGRSAPLFHRLYGQGLVNDTFSYDLRWEAGVSFLTFGGESKSPDQVCLRVLEEAARLASEGICADFFQKRVKTTRGRLIRELNSLDSLCYNVAEAALNGFGYLETLSLLESVTAEDVRRWIDRYMRPELMSISLIKER